MSSAAGDNRVPSPIVLSVVVALIVGTAAAKMYWSPVTTPQTSFINCFNYLGPLQATVLYGGALILSMALLVSAVRMRKATIIYLEGLSLLSVVYGAFVSVTAFEHTQNGYGLTLDIMLSSFFVAGLLWLLRLQMKKLSISGALN